MTRIAKFRTHFETPLVLPDMDDLNKHLTADGTGREENAGLPESSEAEASSALPPGDPPKKSRLFARDQYPGAIVFNFFVFLIPALYATLSKVKDDAFAKWSGDQPISVSYGWPASIPQWSRPPMPMFISASLPR